MLQAIRNRLSGPVAKVFFILLALVFGVWGIGDYALYRNPEQPAIRVGSIEISPARVETEYRAEIARWRQQIPEFTPEAARTLRLLDNVVERLVSGAAFDMLAREQGIVVGDEMVRQQIVADPTFRGPDGRFSRDLFLRRVYDSGLNEAQFFENVRQDMARSLAIAAIVAGARVPAAIAERLFRHREERRSGEYVAVAGAAMTVEGQPTEEDLRRVYDDGVEAFTLPEYRGATVLRVGPDELAARMQPTEADLRDEYQIRVNELRQTELRDIEQIRFPDEAAARAARERLVAGTPFADLAREVLGDAVATFRLEGIPRNALPTALQPAYDLPAEQVSEPIQSPLGWHLVRTARIAREARTPGFEEVRERIETEVRRRMAGDAAYAAANRAEDLVIAGRSLDDAARELDLPLVRVAAVDISGNQPDGAPVPVFAQAQAAAQTLFATDQGNTSQLVETTSGAWIIVRTDSIERPRLLPLEEVRDRVVMRWQQERRRALARARAEEIRTQAAGGAALGEIATRLSLRVEIVEGARRTPPPAQPGAPAPPPAPVVAELFRLAVGGFGVASAGDVFWVVRLGEIRAADPSADAAALAQLTEDVREQMRGDIAREFGAALRARYRVTVDRSSFERFE